MKGLRGQQGFTIVETIIVLAVVGVLFVATALSVQGSINTNKQKDSISQLESGLRNILNDVTNGKYSSNGSLTCNVNGGKISDAKVTQGVSNLGQGNGKNCVYAGKQITFNSNSYDVVSYATLDTDPNALLDSMPVDGSSVSIGYINGMTLKSAQKKFYILNKSYGSSVTSNFSSGAQDVSFYGAPLTVSPLNANITVCFNNSAAVSSLTIGANNTLSTNLKEIDGTIC